MRSSIPALRALEQRVGFLEQLAAAQTHELKIQSERIAQLQAECDILKIRVRKTRANLIVFGGQSTHLNANPLAEGQHNRKGGNLEDWTVNDR